MVDAQASSERTGIRGKQEVTKNNLPSRVTAVLEALAIVVAAKICFKGVNGMSRKNVLVIPTWID